MLLQFDTYFHIYNHANGDDNLFREEKNYSYFLEKYHQHIDPIAETVAWCLMPNHFHLLVKIKTEQEIINNFSSSPKGTFLKFETLEKSAIAEEEKLKFLSKQFSNFFSSYTQSFNKVYKRRGSLFLKNFKRKEVLSERYLRTLILYIHLNPIKHGFTKEINDWNWHSFESFPKEYPELSEALFSKEKDYKDIHLQKKDTFIEYDSIENDIL